MEASVTIRPDPEYNADAFWIALWDQYPTIARKLSDDDIATITDLQWIGIQKLEGFRNGPEHAREALIIVEYEGESKMNLPEPIKIELTGCEYSQARKVFLELIEAVRSDSKIGKGTCSHYDECYTDVELIQEFIEFLVDTAGSSQIREFLKVAHGIDSAFRERDS